MLPGFSAGSSLYHSSNVYTFHGTSPEQDYFSSASLRTVNMVVPADSMHPCPPVGCQTCEAEGMKCCYTGPGGTFMGNCYFGACCPQDHECCIHIEAGGYPYFQGCFDLKTDPNNCGACSHRCSAAEICCDGSCIRQTDDSCNCPPRKCDPGYKCCGSKCLNVTSDTANCGKCGHRCSSTYEKCVNGKCCLPKADIAVAAAIMCLLTAGSDCNAIYQQLEKRACP